jgi:hypothetical protein
MLKIIKKELFLTLQKHSLISSQSNSQAFSKKIAAEAFHQAFLPIIHQWLTKRQISII